MLNAYEPVIISLRPLAKGSPHDAKRYIRSHLAEKKFEIITAAHPFENLGDAQSPHQVKVVVNQSGDALYFSRALIPFVRDASETPKYFRHQGIYGYKRDLLLRFVRWKTSPLERAEALEQLRALENGVRIKVVMTGSGSPGVDTLENVRMIERLLVSTAKRFPKSRR